MTPIGVLAVGAGDRLVSLLSRLERRHPGRVRLEALCDDSSEARAAAASRLGWSGPTHRDLGQALDACAAPWVFVTSRNRLHAEHAIAALDAGRHVFCEKPLALSIDDCLAMRAALRRARTRQAARLASAEPPGAGAMDSEAASTKSAHRLSPDGDPRFVSGLVLRHARIYRTAHGLVENGTLGKIVSFEANEHLAPDHGAYLMRGWRRFRSEAGPHLLEKCCHDLDLLAWMIGSRARRVASSGGLDVFTPANAELERRLAAPGDTPPVYRAWPSWEDVDPFTSEKDIADNQAALLEYANGVRGTFSTNACSALPQRRMLLIGLEGALELDLVAGRLAWRRIGRRAETVECRFSASDLHGGGDDGFVDALVVAMADGDRSADRPATSGAGEPSASGTSAAEPLASLDVALEATVTCLAVDQAMRSGAIVDLDPMWARVDASEE